MKAETSKDRREEKKNNIRHRAVKKGKEHREEEWK